MSALTLEELVQVVIQHRKGNNLPGSDHDTVRRDIEEHICGLMRGTKALWQFCETRFSMPPPETAALSPSGVWTATPPLPVSVSGRVSVSGKPVKLCPTCGNH